MAPASAPIFRFNAAKPKIVEEVVHRVVEGTRDPLLALNDAAYFEIRRLGPKSDASAEWRDLAGSLGRMERAELVRELERLAERYAWDVAGNFDPRVYKFASRAMAPILGALLSPKAALKHLPEMHSLAALDDRIVVQGPTDQIARLAERGTLVFVPTHLSNLDSVVFGFALERAGLPPATYGAGKNLFTNPVLSFFMHNLGAYRVDRRLKHVLYKDVLKAYSGVLLERGYHSLFFPGGTRSRSGGVERRLKLGLAGTGIDAFARTAQAGKAQPVFFVPATINYLLTLEAETLIDDFLQEEGKSRYIIEDDESTRFARVASFAQKLMGLDASVVIRFSSPLDCFGNLVDEEGRSHDERGRPVDALTYLYGEGDTIVRDAARDAQYTRELGLSICRAFKRDTVVMPTHVTAAAAFDELKKKVGKSDLFGLVNYRERVRIPRDEFTAHVEARLAVLHEEEQKGKIVLSAQLRFARAREVIDLALRAFAGYHANPVLVSYGGDIVLEDPRLLFYYQNRLAAHGLAYDVLKH
jgi:glycerol-3-phosphate O-acyltransferase